MVRASSLWLIVGSLALLGACVAEPRPLALNHPANPEALELEGVPPIYNERGSGLATEPGTGATDRLDTTVDSSLPDDATPGSSHDHGSHAEAPDANPGTTHDHGSHAETPDATPGPTHADPEAPDRNPATAHDHKSPSAGSEDGTTGQSHSSQPPDPRSTHDHAATDARGGEADDHGEPAAPHVEAEHAVHVDELSILERTMPGLAAAANIHPVFVHFPIALWPAALLFWVLALARSQDAWFATARWLTYLALAGSLVTAATGLMAEEALGHDSPGHDLVHVHKYFMLTTTALGLATTVVALVARSKNGRLWRFWRWAWGAGLVLTVAVMTVGADRGGLLVYGHGVGTALTETDDHGGTTPGQSTAPGHGAHVH